MTSIRILIAEHNPLLSSGIACLLEQVPDLTVLGETGTVERVLRLAEELKPDVLLLDEHLAATLETDITRRLREGDLPVRVVLITDRAGEDEIYRFIAAGASAFITRQDDADTVFEAVRAAARGDEVWLSPRVAARLVPRRGRKAPSEGLSAREREVLQRVAAGQFNEEIAEALHLAPGTVRNHLSSIYAKLGLHTRAEAVAWAWRQGLVEADQRGNPDTRHDQP